MSSMIIALDLGRNHILASLVRLGQLSHEENLSIERNVFYMRSFDDCIRDDPRLLVSNWMNCIDDLIRDFIEYYQDNDRIVSIACSLSNSINYQNDSMTFNKYQTFFGLNLRLLIQSALRDLILRWKDKPYIKYYTPPTSPRGTLTYLTDQTKQQTGFNIPPALIYGNQTNNLQSAIQKLKDFCGSQENTDGHQLVSSDERERISPPKTPTISFEYPPRLFSIIEHLADIPISFYNQTKCFVLGELTKFSDENYDRILALTLGTHFGSVFIEKGQIIQNHRDIPPNGILSNCRYDEYSLADECFSTRGLISIYIRLIRRTSRIFDGYSLAQHATNGDQDAIQTFKLFAQHLGEFLCPYLDKFRPNLLLIGGGLAQSWYLIESELRQTLNKFSQMEIYFNVSSERSICYGAVQQQISNIIRYKYQLIRQTNQHLLPVTKLINTKTFDIYPCHEIPIGYIGVGHKKLNEKFYRLIQENHVLLIDGFIGIDFDEFANELNKYYFQQKQYSRSRTLMFYSTQVFLQIHTDSKDQENIKSMKDLIDLKKLNYLKRHLSYPCVIIGPGASFVNELSPLIYIDLSRSELRYRLSAQKSSYENQLTSLLYEINYIHSYDYPIFNRYKQELISRIDYFIDGQRPNCPTWLDGNTFRQALAYTSNQAIHLRPSLNLNYGIILSDIDQHLVEFSSDILYYLHMNQILGNDFHRRLFNEFNQFPIEIRLLSTIDRNNSQFHNKQLKLHRAFYRIRAKQQLKENSFIDYQDMVNSKSKTKNKSLKYIPSNIHEFFFSFTDTVGSHKETDLIIEISSTVDLSTKTHELLCIDETKELPCRPISIQIEPEHYNEQRLPTPDFYIYDIHRLIIKADRTDHIIRMTDNRFHLCLLVEGDAIEIEYYSSDNYRQKQIRQYNHWQTFLIPGSIDKYYLRPIVKNAKKYEYFLLLIIFLKWEL